MTTKLKKALTSVAAPAIWPKVVVELEPPPTPKQMVAIKMRKKVRPRYENMKPKDAAQIFDSLELDVLLSGWHDGTKRADSLLLRVAEAQQSTAVGDDVQIIRN